MAVQGNPIAGVPAALSVNKLIGLKQIAPGVLQLVQIDLSLISGAGSIADVNALRDRVDDTEDRLDAIEADVSSVPGALAAKADKTVTVTGAGMATGGGDLSGSRAITVTPATDAEMKARTANKPADARGVGVFVDDWSKGIKIETLPAGSGFLAAMLDNQRRRMWSVTDKGYLLARLDEASYVPRAALDPSVLAGLLPASVSVVSMPQGSGWKIGFMTSDKRLLGGFTEQDRFSAKLADDIVLPQAILDLLLASQNYLPTSNIAAFGNSITEGVGTYDKWTDLLATMLGVSVSNQGRGSQLTREIVARQGGTPMKVSVAGDTIPASGEVAVTAYDVDIGTYGGTPAWLSTPGTLAGVAGSMRGNQDATGGRYTGTYTFVRSVAGTAVACPPDTPFIPTAATTYRGATQIHDCGRNDVGGLGTEATVVDLINRILSMGSYLSPKIKRRLVIGVYSSPSEYAAAGGSNAANYNNIVAFNTRLQREIGSAFLDIQQFLITEGLAAVGLTPTANDLTDIGRNTVPRSLLHSDQLHLNSFGALAFAIAIARRLRALGWY